jgi:hypothetical protein
MIVAHTQGREATSPNPARSDCTIVSVFFSAPRARGWTRVSSTADTTKVAASSANAAPAPTVRNSAVPRAGPTMIDRFTDRPVSAWASCTWSSGTVCGISPV